MIGFGLGEVQVTDFHRVQKQVFEKLRRAYGKGQMTGPGKRIARKLSKAVKELYIGLGVVYRPARANPTSAGILEPHKREVNLSLRQGPARIGGTARQESRNEKRQGN